MQTDLAETSTWKTSLFVPRVRALSPSAELTAAVTPSHLQKRTPFRGLHEHESKVLKMTSSGADGLYLTSVICHLSNTISCILQCTTVCRDFKQQQKVAGIGIHLLFWSCCSTREYTSLYQPYRSASVCPFASSPPTPCKLCPSAHPCTLLRS